MTVMSWKGFFLINPSILILPPFEEAGGGYNITLLGSPGIARASGCASTKLLM